MKPKPLYIRIISENGQRENAVIDMPEKKPNRAEFEQYILMQSLRRDYSAHMYSRGMRFTEPEAINLVNVLMNDPSPVQGF